MKRLSLKRYLSLAVFALAFTAMAVTVYWYSQAPYAGSTLADNDIFLIERPSPHTNLYSTLGDLKGYVAASITNIPPGGITNNQTGVTLNGAFSGTYLGSGTFSGAFAGAFNGNGAGLSNVTASVTNLMSISTNFFLSDSMRVINHGIEYYGVNRGLWPRSAATMATNGFFKLWMVGSGWANDSDFEGVFTNLLAYKPLAGYGTMVTWVFAQYPQYTFGPFSGNDTAVYHSGNDTNWHQQYFSLDASGQIASPNYIVSANVAHIAYIKGPLAGTFLLEYRTNSYNANSFLQLDATWNTALTINANNGSWVGEAQNWTNTQGVWPTQIRVRSTSSGSTPVVEYGLWNNTLTNGVVIGQWAHSGSDVWWVDMPTNVTYPIWQVQDPTMVLLTGGNWTDSQIASVKASYGYMKSNFPSADVVAVEPHETGASDPTMIGHWATKAWCYSNSIPYFNGELASYEAWGSYSHADLVLNLYQSHGDSHLSNLGFNLFGEFIWAWLGLVQNRAPVGVTMTYAIPGGATIYVTNGIIYQIQ